MYRMLFAVRLHVVDLPRTHYQEELIAWKKKHCTIQTDEARLGELGNSFWNGFMKRHKHRVS